MTRYLPYFRIAFTAVCGIACVLICVLWVRSYWWIDYGTVASRLEASSFYGAVRFRFAFPPYSFEREWYYARQPAIEYFPSSSSELETVKRNLLTFSLPSSQSGTMPHWFLVALSALSATFAAAPWIRWRFSLRTLLIATTLVALVLGLVMWAIR